MARRYYRRSYRLRDEISHEYARQHIEDYHRLVRELGGSVEDVKQYLFSRPPQKLREILDAYEAKHGTQKRNYLKSTIEKWRTGKRRMSGTVAERLFALLPSRMPLAAKYQLIENLWNHVGPKSKKTLHVGLDANIDQVLEAITSHINDVVTHFRMPDELERRFNWLAAGDSHAKQDLLNHLRSMEKALVVEGARIQLPVLLDHLRGDAGQYTHHVAEVLKIGNHELELLIDKNASGVAVVEPYVPFQRTISQAATATGGASFKWLWWAAAAAVALYLFARPQTPSSSYQSYTPSTTRQPNTQSTTHQTYGQSTTYQPNTQSSAPLQPERRLSTLPTASQSDALPSDAVSDHRPGRVACDVRWSDLQAFGSPIGASNYQDFIRSCMKRNPQ